MVEGVFKGSPQPGDAYTNFCTQQVDINSTSIIFLERKEDHVNLFPSMICSCVHIRYTIPSARRLTVIWIWRPSCSSRVPTVRK